MYTKKNELYKYGTLIKIINLKVKVDINFYIPNYLKRSNDIVY